MTSLPRLAITMGDPSGVGPELCLRLLAEKSITSACHPVIFGDAGVLRLVARRTGQKLTAAIVSAADWPEGGAAIDEPTILDFAAIDAERVVPGKIDASTGAASFLYINRAIDAAPAGEVVGVTTSPISKEALHAAGYDFPGHTEIFASRTSAARSCMMQFSDEITCSFVTTHIGYRDVPARLTTGRILEVIELTAEALQRLRKHPLRLVVSGLNPHAGENGLFGDREEERIIVPAIEAARRAGLNIEGPLPADTAFVPAKRLTTDAFICMYHDQGHIPVKALAFDSAVNTTLGLPIVRTSVDHGTAADIAWQGLASPGSLFSAVRLALRLAG
jgi:4-hydroxythreonine-4-phosphate dehydrogenase